MCKKLGVVALVAVAALFTLHKLDLLGYGKLLWHKAQESTSGAISPELKLERLKLEVNNLTPELNRQRAEIAKAMVGVEQTTKEIAVVKANLKDREEKLAMLREELKKGNGDVVVINDEKMSRQKVEDVFTRKFSEFTAAEQALKAKEDLLGSRKKKLDIAQQHLSTMQSKQTELKDKVAKMELELASLREAQMQNDVAVDDSKFSEVMKLYDDVSTQIATQKKQLELQKAADTDAVVEKALEQKAQTKKAIELWDDRASAKSNSNAKVTNRE